MLAMTIDLGLVVLAWMTVLAAWQARRCIQPTSIWEKLMVGSTLVAFSLLVRFADALWTQIPWPALSDPLVQQAVVLIGLLGGALAIAAGVAEWVPGMISLGIEGRWREIWAQQQSALEKHLADAGTAERVISVLTGHFSSLCESSDVVYCAYHQRLRRFMSAGPSGARHSTDIAQGLSRVERTRTPVKMRTETGWLAAVPVNLGTRLYGAMVIFRASPHPALGNLDLMQQSARRGAVSLSALVHEAHSVHAARLAASTAELERLIGHTADPTTDLLEMLAVVQRELQVDYAAALMYESDGAYARRFSRLKGRQAYVERGLEVSMGHEVLPQSSDSPEAVLSPARGLMMSPAVIPHDQMHHRIAVPLYRGRTQVGLLVAASMQKGLRISATDTLRRYSPCFTAAIERVAATRREEELTRRAHALGRLAGRPVHGREGFDHLAARMLEEIPGTFCQYMRVAPDGRTLRVEYRRARRGGWGNDTTGQRFELALLPTCRMVMATGRSVLFRQDDPERHFEPHEAEVLFGAVPNSLLLVPVIQEGRCMAVLAVGELREVRRHTFSVEDRRFADTLARLHAGDTPDSHRQLPSLGTLGDLNLVFASPLTGILGSVEILRQSGQGGETYGKYLDVIERNVSRIRETVTELAELTFDDTATPAHRI